MKNNLKANIRPATLADLSALVALEAATFDYSQMGRASFRRLLQSSTAHFQLAEAADNLLLGYYLLLTRSNSKRWRLYSIATSTQARGLGLGRALLEHAIAYARSHGASELSLEVKTDNKAAIALYHALDFAVVDLLLNYYDDDHHSDGYRMRLTL
jgi:ribosomal protein S18 acetylase RimI-like enzyme